MEMLSNGTILYAAIGVTVACMLFVTRTILSHFGKDKLIKSFDKYKPYAIMASKWVEKNIPDNYGAESGDPTTARAIHKLDTFLKKFTEIVRITEGIDPTDALKNEAMNWSVELAERMNMKKAEQ